LKQLKQKFNNSPNYILRDDGYLANIALLYYQEGLNQGEIATRLGLSRTNILNYLKEGIEIEA
jgi:DNA-binding transcriptional regulator LsrR (DeoR family)